MHIGVFSDTHDRLPALDAALEDFSRRGIETIIHAGDIVSPFAAKRLAAWPGTLHVIYGNNDGERPGLKAILPTIQDGPLWVEAEGRRILVHHFIDWCAPEDVARADIVITGHTHERINETRDGRLMLNPGECCGWLSGECTVALLDTRAMSAEIIEVNP